MMEERKMILQMVEEGKISPEDGSKLIRALSPENEKKTTSSAATRKSAEEPTSSSTDLSTKIDWEESNRHHDESRRRDEEGAKGSPLSEGARWFSEFVDSTVHKIRELDLDFNFGSAQEINHIFQHTNMKERTFDLSLENGSIDIRPWDEADGKIECNAKVYKAENEEDARRIFLEDAVFESVEDKLHFYTKSKKIKLEATVYVPRERFDKLSLYTFNGHLHMTGLSGTSLTAKAVNGSIDIEDVHADVLEAETVNGPIDIDGGASERADLRTVHGTIDINGRLQDIDAESVNGSVNCRYEGKESGHVSLAATTGSVFLVVPEGIRTEGKLKTNVGNYHWKLPNVEVLDENRDFIQKTLSLVSNPEESAVLRVDASTKTGSISLKTHDR
ncbi:DUF4097 family beta strand repeat-containing protein [Natribacillus halophilus]|uniref:DUF4097 and DUF4098 domain-containing protein YvlB n=1 Tax=Natribacillus halophilus TaxID=549003 RepID=A0A1G8KMD2_9BACI|nr:DUF4097 domain-containing protein [Natribacillus halophilus]SDI44579.1 DUF4097 and DUF4098 domain-containing protein YvlB [Natribacillus halophilus]